MTRGGRQHTITETERQARDAKIVRAYNDGVTVRDLAGRFSLGGDYVRKVLREARDRGEAVRAPVSGRQWG